MATVVYWVAVMAIAMLGEHWDIDPKAFEKLLETGQFARSWALVFDVALIAAIFLS